MALLSFKISMISLFQAVNHFKIHYTILKFSDLFKRLGLIINLQALVLDPSSILPYLDITFSLKSVGPYLPKNKTKLQSEV